MALSINPCSAGSVKKFFHCIAAMEVVSPLALALAAFLKVSGSAALGVPMFFETLQAVSVNNTKASPLIYVFMSKFKLSCDFFQFAYGVAVMVMRVAIQYGYRYTC